MSTTTSTLKQLNSLGELQGALMGDHLLLLCFWEDKALESHSVHEIAEEFAELYSQIDVFMVEISNAWDIVGLFSAAVGSLKLPCFVFLRGNDLLEHRSDADSSALRSAIAPHLRPTRSDEEAKAELTELLNENKILLLMKGSPDRTDCPSSMGAVFCLRQNEVPFAHCNVRANEAVRRAALLSGHRTFPQLYIDSKYFGGVDKIMEMDGRFGTLDALRGALP